MRREKITSGIQRHQVHASESSLCDGHAEAVPFQLGRTDRGRTDRGGDGKPAGVLSGSERLWRRPQSGHRVRVSSRADRSGTWHVHTVTPPSGTPRHSFPGLVHVSLQLSKGRTAQTCHCSSGLAPGVCRNGMGVECVRPSTLALSPRQLPV